ncbi:hypothetical protein ACMFMF_006169 [Clarireedia jacksonii]
MDVFSPSTEPSGPTPYPISLSLVSPIPSMQINTSPPLSKSHCAFFPIFSPMPSLPIFSPPSLSPLPSTALPSPSTPPFLFYSPFPLPTLQTSQMEISFSLSLILPIYASGQSFQPSTHINGVCLQEKILRMKANFKNPMVGRYATEICIYTGSCFVNWIWRMFLMHLGEGGMDGNVQVGSAKGDEVGGSEDENVKGEIRRYVGSWDGS